MQIAWLPKTITREHIFGLDAFRGLAALFVFFFHFWTFYLLGEQVNLWKLDITAPFAAGHLGVDMFFVISGFLIFLSLVTLRSYEYYARKRLFRIVPLAWAFTLAVFLLQQNFSPEGWFDFWAHIFFFQSLFPETYHGLNPVMWTLSVEVLFYLLLPILLFFGKRKWWHFWGVLLVLGILNFWYRWHVMQYFPEWTAAERIFYSEQLWGRFDQFILGIGLAHLWIFRGKIQKFVQKIYPILLFLGLLGFLFTMNIFSRVGSAFREVVWMQMFLHFFVAFFFVLFLSGFLFAPQKIQKIFAPKFLLFLGVISYSIYLWHFLVIGQLYEIEPKTASGFALTLGVTILLSAVSYYLIERPFLKKKAGAIGE